MSFCPSSYSVQQQPHSCNSELEKNLETSIVAVVNAYLDKNIKQDCQTPRMESLKKNILALDFSHDISKNKTKTKQLNQSTKKFHCSFCRKSYYQKSHQLRHERIDHQPPKFKCPICMQLFKQKVHLQRHQMNTICKDKTNDVSQLD